MVKFIVLVFLFFGWTQNHTSAQNLVLNSGFEEFTNCPTGLNNFEDVQPWCSPTAGSPDYFNLCGNYYYKSRTKPFEGNGYAGLILFSDNETVNEYMQIELTQPLLPGVNYRFQSAFKLDELSPFYTSTITVGFQKHNRFYDYWAKISPLSYFQIQLKQPFRWQYIDTVFTVSDTVQSLLLGNFLPEKSLHQEFNEYGKKNPGWACYLYLDALQITPADASPQQQQVDAKAALGSTQQKDTTLIVYFDVNQHQLTPLELERFLQFFKSIYFDEIVITGHTDSDGNNHYNNTLSELRARYIFSSLQEFLKNREISYLASIGFKGENQPLNGNKTNQEKALNRRVEINLINFRAN